VSDETPAATGPAPEPPPGPELARAALEAALARRKVAPRRSGRDGDGASTGRGKRPRGYSGPGPDPRDPQPFGAVLAKLVRSRGWQKPAAEARVFGEWEKVVGADVAGHCRPVKLEDGELTIEAESTAWATQLKLLAAKLLVRIAGEVGNGVVKRLHVHGPAAPSWQRGPRRVRGRGPRDTYG
jgi:predicted nucleic acid-binding Zn ribbon protein